MAKRRKRREATHKGVVREMPTLNDYRTMGSRPVWLYETGCYWVDEDGVKWRKKTRQGKCYDHSGNVKAAWNKEAGSAVGNRQHGWRLDLDTIELL